MSWIKSKPGDKLMKTKILLGLIICTILLIGSASAELRIYRQIKDVVIKENGQVSQSNKKENLFKFTFDIDQQNKTITRTKIWRQDKSAASDDKTIYNIMKNEQLLGSEAGNGGKVLVAVSKTGDEILELGHRFAFTMRTSPFSQVITGVYKRVYVREHKKFLQKCQKTNAAK